MTVLKLQRQPEQDVMLHLQLGDSNESMYFSFTKHLQKATNHLYVLVKLWSLSMCIETPVISKGINGSKQKLIDV
jgi:hypothetical protein